MSTNEKRDLAPDNHLLAEIFPNTKTISTEILSQNFVCCTFTARLESGEEFIVRIEPEDSQTRAVSAIQELAAQVIPDYVPTVHKTGTASDKDGRKFDYSVTTYFKGAVTLESVWSDFTDDQQLHVAAQVASVVEKLHSINLDGKAQQFGKPEDKTPSIPLGGPSLGFFSNLSDLVCGLVKAEDGFKQVTITETDGNLAFECEYDDIPSVSIFKEDILSLKKDIVLCHNDLEPRNILVRQDNTDHYKIVAIIDWEMAGFFPFTFESFYKDLVLGSSNLYFPWYRLFKDQTARLLPKPLPAAQEALLKTLDMVLQANARPPTRNVGRFVQRKWIAREQLVRSEDLSLGWVRSPEAGDVGRFTKEDNEQLELSALRELGYIN
ncbi:hypothetical protein ASPVEDRAFT_873010 [Aspergillus versicolor CBS 583.65]|uniref:Aminoglycoside phosphotransferase domain-containing protein n=1 Tax=Aspergillus versicolor CBS 583.65 TaxID=1036611 RepID=A0A1L9P644_ASPVE|nr:uncharacterized protein ASPVEDRAFT_873010 [Aspergillus versicolor CBS 583.65]OJI96966.1 hypothetical protein ASPVEDRAFT_873010 [Aspergillus versicolor CBS 583.65]